MADSEGPATVNGHVPAVAAGTVVFDALTVACLVLVNVQLTSSPAAGVTVTLLLARSLTTFAAAVPVHVMSVRTNVPVPVAFAPSTRSTPTPGVTVSAGVDAPLPIAVSLWPATVNGHVPVPPIVVLEALTVACLVFVNWQVMSSPVAGVTDTDLLARSGVYVTVPPPTLVHTMLVSTNVPVPAAIEPSENVVGVPGTTSSELVVCPLPMAVLVTPATVKFQVSLPVPPTTVLPARTLPGGMRVASAWSVCSVTLTVPTSRFVVPVLTNGD